MQKYIFARSWSAALSVGVLVLVHTRIEAVLGHPTDVALWTNFTAPNQDDWFTLDRTTAVNGPPDLLE